MKKVIYPFFALMLILPLMQAAGKPTKAAESVEPKQALSVQLSGNYLLPIKTAEEKQEEKKEVVAQPLAATPTPVVEEKTKGKLKKFEVTAYTAGYESTQKKKGQKGYGVTASGTQVQEGRTVACPKSIDFGTKLYIPSLDHVYICEDRGGAITEGHLDIYFEDINVALDFGRQFDVEVYIMDSVSY